MSAPFPPPARRAGFTLVELLVAIAVLAIVAVLGWRGLDGIIRSRQALTAQMEQTRGIQLAFAQLQSDLQQLAGRDLLHRRAALLAGPGRMTLVRTVFAETEATRLQVVSYRIRDGVLTRRESAATRDLAQLDVLWQAALSDADPAPGIALQSGVAGLTVRVWENGGWMAPAATAQDAGTAQGTGAVQGAAPPASPGPAEEPAGLELALQLQGQASSLVKIFLLGEK